MTSRLVLIRLLAMSWAALWLAVGRAGAASYGLVESAALSAPVLLVDGSPLGSLMLLSTDPMHVRQLESSRRPLG